MIQIIKKKKKIRHSPIILTGSVDYIRLDDKHKRCIENK